MTNYNDIEHIESYLRGEMEGSERQAFEAQMAKDEALQAEVKAYRQIFSGFAGLREEAFAKEVAKWTQAARTQEGGKVVPIKKTATRRTLWRRLAIAASVVLLLGLATNWWAGQQYSNEAIVSRAYAPPLSSGTMGGGNEAVVSALERQYEEAHQLFQNGQYDEAVQVFGQFMVSMRNNENAFDKLTYDAYYNNARWTILLSLFSTGVTTEEDLRTELQRMAAEPSNEYAEKARHLLNDLDSFWRKLD